MQSFETVSPCPCVKTCRVGLHNRSAADQEVVSAWITAHPEVDVLPMVRSSLTAQCLEIRLLARNPHTTSDGRRWALTC